MIPALAAVLIIGLTGWLLGPALPMLFSVAVPLAGLALFITGFLAKVLSWSAAPSPFPIALTAGQQQSLDWIPANRLEAPPGKLWTACRVALEVLCFRSLLRNSNVSAARDTQGERRILYLPTWSLWCAAMLFHYSLLVILLRHLRFFLDPLPEFVAVLGQMDGVFQVGLPRLYMSGLLILAALAFLLGRRLWDARLRYISLPADYFFLFLLLGIVCTGLYMRHWDKVDAVSIKTFAMGLVTFRPTLPESASPAFFAHLLLASVLLACIPQSKIMHMGGILLSPTRAMPNDSRQIHRKNPWNPPKEYRTYAEYEDDFHEAMAEVGLPLERALQSMDAPAGADLNAPRGAGALLRPGPSGPLERQGRAEGGSPARSMSAPAGAEKEEPDAHE